MRQTELDHKPKKEDPAQCITPMLVVTAGFVISIVILFMIFVKDVGVNMTVDFQ